MRIHLKRALFDALEGLGEQNREMVLCHLQRYYAIRLVEESHPSVAEIEFALNETFGSSAHIFVSKFKEELQRHPASIVRTS